MLGSAANDRAGSENVFTPAPSKHPKMAQMHRGGAGQYPYRFSVFFRHQGGRGRTLIETNMLKSF